MSAVATQLPPTFSNFYSVSTQVSAALIGLLFVAVSVGTESVFGPRALLLTRRGNDLGLLTSVNTLIIAAYAFGLARAWMLLGGIAGHRLWRHLGRVVRERHEHADNTTHTEDGRPE